VLISDFDGTIARLDLDWADLRRRCEVRSIGELWNGPASGWEPITRAEVRAARIARPVQHVLDLIEGFGEVAVLTNNSELSVAAFLEPRRELAAMVRCTVGRETLGAPKNDFPVFLGGVEMCAAALGVAEGFSSCCYIGDQDYELDFARHLGMDVVDARVER
jgi:phosphoglycolate phosphatase-like HAD superfamily hydrolase